MSLDGTFSHESIKLGLLLVSFSNRAVASSLGFTVVLIPSGVTASVMITSPVDGFFVSGSQQQMVLVMKQEKDPAIDMPAPVLNVPLF